MVMGCYLSFVMFAAGAYTSKMPQIIAPHTQRSRVSTEVIQAKKVTFNVYSRKFDGSPRKKETDREYKSRGQMRTVEFY
jgi:hypothetical protein